MSEVNYYAYKIQPTRLAMLTQGPTPEEEAIITEHFNYLKSLTDQGVAIFVGRTLTTNEHTFGITVFKAATTTSAQEIMNNDPAVSHGVMRAELYPFRVVLMTDKKID